jgi:hypothetical protein
VKKKVIYFNCLKCGRLDWKVFPDEIKSIKEQTCGKCDGEKAGEEILNNVDDFYWYRKRIDARDKYGYYHNGTPISYPCKVRSVLKEDPDGNQYDHSFIYF